MIAVYLDDNSVKQLRDLYPDALESRMRKVVLEYGPSDEGRASYESLFGKTATVKVGQAWSSDRFVFDGSSGDLCSRCRQCKRCRFFPRSGVGNSVSHTITTLFTKPEQFRAFDFFDPVLLSPVTRPPSLPDTVYKLPCLVGPGSD